MAGRNADRDGNPCANSTHWTNTCFTHRHLMPETLAPANLKDNYQSPSVTFRTKKKNDSTIVESVGAQISLRPAEREDTRPRR